MAPLVAADHVAQRELRDVVPYRKRLIEDRAREANRLQKVLETANIKLASALLPAVCGARAAWDNEVLVVRIGIPRYASLR